MLRYNRGLEFVDILFRSDEYMKLRRRKLIASLLVSALAPK